MKDGFDDTKLDRTKVGGGVGTVNTGGIDGSTDGDDRGDLDGNDGNESGKIDGVPNDGLNVEDATGFVDGVSCTGFTSGHVLNLHRPCWHDCPGLQHSSLL